MGGHVDDAELTHDHPVVSMSLGRPCAFIVGVIFCFLYVHKLLGGLTKDDPATAILLRSGDTVLLSNHSRLCYHGVSRIFDCPYTSNYRRESGRKRGKCSDACLPICCENKSVSRKSTDHSLTGSDCYHNMDDFLWHNEVSSEILHTSLEGIRCSMRKQQQHDSILETLKRDQCPHCQKTLLPKEEVQKVLNYLRFSRINLNVRQVYPTADAQQES